MDKVKLVKNRTRFPAFHSHGYLKQETIHSIQKFSEYAIHNLVDQVGETFALRSKSGIDISPEFHITHYLMQESTDGSLSSPSYTQPVSGTEDIIADIERVLDSKIYNLKLAIMDPSGEVDFHIDDPIKERFTCVIQGKQEIHVKTREGTITYNPQIGEVVYLNTNWPHAVYNLVPEMRIALVGCYDLYWSGK